MALGTIVCDTNHFTLDALVSACGLRAAPTEAEREFDIVSTSHHGEPEVEDELFSMALNRLRVATDSGVLPDWRVICRN